MCIRDRPKAPRPELGGRSFFDVTDGGFAWKKYMEAAGGVLLPGYQLRYIYFIDKSMRRHLTVPEIPYSRIDELGAGMYKGEKITLAERHVGKEADNGPGKRDCDAGNPHQGGDPVYEGACRLYTSRCV